MPSSAVVSGTPRTPGTAGTPRTPGTAGTPRTPGAGASLRKLARRPLVALVIVALLLWADRLRADRGTPPVGSASSQPAAGPPPAAGTGAAPRKCDEDIEDPIALIAAGKDWLGAGDAARARECFAASVKRHEVNLYSELHGRPWGDALVHELMGEHAEAEALYQKSFAQDVLSAYHTLAHFSNHPRRAALLAAAKAHVEGLVAKAKAGEHAPIYVTSKGEERSLRAMTQEAAQQQLLAGETLRYVYFDVLDLRKARWQKAVSCQRCVAGTILAWDADFEDQFDFKGFVLGDFHAGKKWAGEVNKSDFEPASRFNRLYLDSTVFFGKADFDSTKIAGRVANFPFAVFMGDTNFRNVQFGGTAEFRFAHFAARATFKGSQFAASAYFAHSRFGGLDLSRTRVENRPLYFASARFSGDLLVEEAAFLRGVTFENARFDGNVTFRSNSVDGQLNLSRSVIAGELVFVRNEIKDLLMYGSVVEKNAHLHDNVVLGKSRFALDEVTRRRHLGDVGPLHKLYKLYQGDDDAEEDLTRKSQYGVGHVDDLVSHFHGSVSFANTNFKELVGFERVKFGSPQGQQPASFYNTQFGGEAHFEGARFYGIADFRTMGGSEISFNQARFYSHWLLDDANISTRLTMTEADLLGSATLSLSGADIQALGIDHRQLLKMIDKPWQKDHHRLFYEQCARALASAKDVGRYLDDPRLSDARWDAEAEVALSDEREIIRRARRLCVDRTIDEFTRLRHSFESRSMSESSDWAYWHLKHYSNHRRSLEGVFGAVIAFGERMVFEKAFGWGVLLANLLVTGFVLVLFFAVLIRLLCGDMEVDWDEQPTSYRELSPFALLLISMHAFLGGFGVADAFLHNSSSTYKTLFTSEMIAGIIVITFFIGAYTRLVVSG